MIVLLATAAPAPARAAAPGADGRPAAPATPHPPTAELLPSSALTFRASDPLETITGHAPFAASDLAVDPAHPASAHGSLTVRTHAITTGNVLRDENAYRGVFDTNTIRSDVRPGRPGSPTA
ncbi:MAG: hypothetical protein P8Y02_06425 [Deinococcales bacterium]